MNAFRTLLAGAHLSVASFPRQLGCARTAGRDLQATRSVQSPWGATASKGWMGTPTAALMGRLNSRSRRLSSQCRQKEASISRRFVTTAPPPRPSAAKRKHRRLLQQHNSGPQARWSSDTLLTCAQHPAHSRQKVQYQRSTSPSSTSGTTRTATRTRSKHGARSGCVSPDNLWEPGTWKRAPVLQLADAQRCSVANPGKSLKEGRSRVDVLWLDRPPLRQI